jgi:RND family efflux transporter MFP subunit
MLVRACLPTISSLSFIACLGWLAILASSGCGGGHAAPAEAGKKAEPEAIRGEVTLVEAAPWPAVVKTQGSLIADEVTIVGAKVAGRVDEVDVDLGDMLTAGTPLATLNQADFRLQVSLAEAQLMQGRAALGLAPTDPVENLNPENAPPVREAKAVWDETRTRVDRVRQLQQRAKNAVTQEELDQLVAGEAAAAARHAAAINAVREKIALIGVRSSELAVAQQRLADTLIVAPFDGLVDERHVARGSFVQIGDPIVTLVKTSILRYRGTMPERHAHRLALGQQITLTIEGDEQPRMAQVTRISPTVDEASRSLMFEAAVENSAGDLRTGLFAEGEVVVDPVAKSLIVPKSAVMEFAGSEKVWKVVDGQAREQVVRTSRRGEQGLEIVAGLAAGDIILSKAIDGRVARVEPTNNPVATAASADEGSSEPVLGE